MRYFTAAVNRTLAEHGQLTCICTRPPSRAAPPGAESRHSPPGDLCFAGFDGPRRSYQLQQWIAPTTVWGARRAPSGWTTISTSVGLPRVMTSVVVVEVNSIARALPGDSASRRASWHEPLRYAPATTRGVVFARPTPAGTVRSPERAWRPACPAARSACPGASDPDTRGSHARDADASAGWSP